jgi:hypothetical protein
VLVRVGMPACTHSHVRTRAGICAAPDLQVTPRPVQHVLCESPRLVQPRLASNTCEQAPNAVQIATDSTLDVFGMKINGETGRFPAKYQFPANDPRTEYGRNYCTLSTANKCRSRRWTVYGI